MTRAAYGDEQAAGAVFDALSDTTRRSVLRRVAEDGPLTATALAQQLPVSRQAIAKHLAVLQDAGLVTSSRAGRETRYAAATAPLTATARWLETTGAAWDGRLDRLRSLAAGGAGPAPKAANDTGSGGGRQ